MSRRLDVYQVDVFTRVPFRGNPAGVVPEADGLTAAEMQAIARELNLSETAFLFGSGEPDVDVEIRFFTPSTEVPSCGHATVAAHYVRGVRQGLEPGRYWHRIGIGRLPVDLRRHEGDYRVAMTQARPRFAAPLDDDARAALLAALGVEPAQLDARCPVQLVDTGHAKILVGLGDRATLDGLRPSAAALERFAARGPAAGVFVFTLDAPEPELLTHARMFAPHIGIFEDPVTGNGNGPLGAYLVRHGLVPLRGTPFAFRSRQGEAMGRPGTAHVEVEVEGGEPVEVRVAGDAVIALEGELILGGS